MPLTGNGILMDTKLWRFQFPNWPGLAPRSPEFADEHERTDDEAAYIGGKSEREERLSSRSDD
jgi:hypothetical protein